MKKIIRADSVSLTYAHPSELPIGQIVIVEVGKKQMIGVILSETKKPTYQTKEIISTIEEIPVPKQLIELSLWLSEYYLTPLASVLQTILPSGVNKKRRPSLKTPNISKRNRTNILFNDEQVAVINTLDEYESGTFLFQGVTGSGKTEVYIELAKKAVSNNKSAIILVPEIALTSQIIAEFSNHFEDLLVTHSKMTEAKRHLIWTEALNSKQPRVVIGPRSALFLPLRNIGLIVIDEAHEPSYKQEQSPKYSALRAASMLGRFHGAKVVFGSATPNATDRYLAEKSDKPILTLTKKARQNTKPPVVSLIDSTKKDNFKRHRFLSDKLISQIETNLNDNKQTLIFHNRRGSTNVTLCKNCGWKAECPNCFLPLTLHTDSHSLICHVCNHRSKAPTSCPQCRHADIVHKGIGTKLIESELQKIFKDANIARFDADNSIDEAINERYQDLYDGVIDIAIGTQIVAKGLDLPHLRTVGIIQADSGLALPDFYTNERIFQLLTQVIGRVGRNEHQTQVVIQSYQPDHPSIKHSLTQDYETFYKEIINERKRGLFPPFTHLLKLTCLYKTEAIAIKNAQKLASELRQKLGADVQVLGPTPAFYEQQFGTYRWQLLLKSPKRKYLINALKLIPPGEHWQFDLDPASLL